MPQTASIQWPADDVALAAREDLPVLVTSETRDRRTMCSQLIHAISDAREGPFVTFVSGGELGRHCEQARGGTLFIDDIAALTRAEQVLLSALLENDRRTRVIAGASRHLDAELEDGSVSEALFYRLNLIHVDLTEEA
jgi:two-component system C4-dicarboxylate transport response regulator DctD